MANNSISDIHEYAKADLAGKYSSTAGSQTSVDVARVDELEAQVRRDGFIIVKDIVTPELIEQITQDVRPRFVHAGGRNNFEGMATQRLYSVIEKTLLCNSLVEHPLVLNLLDRFLEPNYLLSQLQVIDILPDEVAQPLHYDDAFYPWPRPRRPLGAATIFAMDEFTEENGATVFIPKSHLWDDHLPTTEDRKQLRSAVMPAGSMLFFLGTLWHAGGANRTTAPRLCVTAQYCAPFLRTQENYSLSISRDRVLQCSEHIQRLLGYSIHAPFAGMVDGMHPKRLLE